MAGHRRESIAEGRARRAEVDDPEKVLEAAARFLEVRPRSTAEVRTRLRGAGYRAELVDAAIERLMTIGYLDDETFARSWVESRDRARPRGESALRRELRLKGVEPAVVDVVLEDRRLGPDGAAAAHESVATPDETAARRLLERHRRTLDRVADPRARRQRAYALLARNGFDPDTCRRLASAFETDRAVDDDGDSSSAS